ncbi:MAG: cation transporter [Bacteroidales bacterium]|nr:cation transporter [Bacteroidales bacterium]
MKKFLAFIIVAAMAVSSVFAADSAADQKRGKKSKAELKEVTWTVNLHCENCVEKVNENLAFEKGVKDLKVSLEEGTVYIKYDSSKTSEETLAAAMKKLGYEVSAACDCGHDHSHEGHDHSHEGHDHSHEGHDHGHNHQH